MGYSPTMASEEQESNVLEDGEQESLAAEGDIFSRPSKFRLSAVRAVWDKAPRGPKRNTRMDWRNGVVVGPWKEGESRDGIWDMGHVVAWYKVVDELRKVEGVTRKDVLDEFNNIDNLGVEDPVTNRELGVNSRSEGVYRLPEEHAEAIMASAHEEAKMDSAAYRARVQEKEANMKARIRQLAEGKATMSAANAAENGKLPERIIIWDTETTGLSHARGDKLVDVAAIELINGKPSGREFHEIINPLRDIPAGATRVHAIDNETVKGKPTFPEIADAFLEFIGDAPLVAHNARFDIGFLNAELEDAGKPTVDPARSIDSLKLARALVPESPKHDLDTLGEHLGVDISPRHPYHGALRCSTVLKDIFLKLEDIAEQKGVPIFAAVEEAGKTAAYTAEADGAQVIADQQMLNEANAERLSAQQAQQGFAARERVREHARQADAGEIAR